MSKGRPACRTVSLPIPTSPPASSGPSAHCGRPLPPSEFPVACWASSIGTASVLVRAIGAAQLVPNMRPMGVETWFDLASLTKVIFTTPRILALARSRHDRPRRAARSPCCPIFASTMPTPGSGRSPSASVSATRRRFPAVEPIYTYGRDPELLRAFVLQREWQAGEPGLFRHQLHPARHRARTPGRQDRSATWTPALDSPGRADPRTRAATENCTWRASCAVGRGARRELLGPAGRRPRRAIRYGGRGARLRARPARRNRCFGEGDRTDAPAARGEAHARLGTPLSRTGRAAIGATPKPSAIPASPAPACGSTSPAARRGPCSPTASIRPGISTAASFSFGSTVGDIINGA